MVRILIDLQPSELGRISGSRKLSLMIKQYVSHSRTDSSIKCSSCDGLTEDENKIMYNQIIKNIDCETCKLATETCQLHLHLINMPVLGLGWWFFYQWCNVFIKPTLVAESYYTINRQRTEEAAATDVFRRGAAGSIFAVFAVPMGGYKALTFIPKNQFATPVLLSTHLKHA